MASLQPDVPFVLGNRSIDYPRPIKVSFLSPHRYSQIICIGAGINGIITAIRFAQKIRNLSLVVYEKNADVGGTWFENTYPSVACDLPAHTYNLGRNDVDLADIIAERGFSVANMSICMSEFPNYFMQTHPTFSVGYGNMIIVFKKINKYFVNCIQKIQREGIKSMVIKPEAVQDF